MSSARPIGSVEFGVKCRLPYFSWGAFLILLSSLLLGLLHQRWLAGTAAGMLYALVDYRRGKLSGPVLAHATTNRLITMSVLSTGEWHKWS